MRTLKRITSAALLLTALFALACVAGGCGKKEETSAPGYYSGPMQSKAAAGGGPQGAKTGKMGAQ